MNAQVKGGGGLPKSTNVSVVCIFGPWGTDITEVRNLF